MMNRVRFSILTSIFGLIFSFVGTASATTYYVSSSSGSDSNSASQAQSKSSPWAHLPGMANASGNVSGYTPVAGDTFILKGCDSWLNASFPIQWSWAGSNGNLITVTVDKTWYNTTACPSGWNRPIFNAQKSVITSAGAECGGPVHNVFVIQTGSYTTFAWIEATGLAWSGSCQNSGVGYFNGNPSNDTFDNWYVHNFYPTSGNSNDSPNMFWVQYPGGACGVESPTPNCTVSNTVINNCDVAGSGQVQYGGAVGGVNSIGNIFSCLGNAIKTYGGGIIANNYVTRISEVSNGGHPNCLETLTSVTSGVIYYIHDNFINESTLNSGCEGGQVGNPGETDFMWNNVWYMVDTGTSVGSNGPQVPSSDGAAWSLYFWNNTVYWSAGCMITGGHGTVIQNLYVQNNHCINNNGYTVYTGSGGAQLAPTGGSSVANNLAMPIATATTQGYTLGNLFSPTAAYPTNATVGQGANLSTDLTSMWPGQTSTMNTSTLQASNPTGTNGACQQQTVGGVVQSVCPTNPPTARGSSWDVGAYQWSSSSTTSGPVNPPSGLLAIVQ